MGLKRGGGGRIILPEHIIYECSQCGAITHGPVAPASSWTDEATAYIERFTGEKLRGRFAPALRDPDRQVYKPDHPHREGTIDEPVSGAICRDCALATVNEQRARHGLDPMTHEEYEAKYRDNPI